MGAFLRAFYGRFCCFVPKFGLTVHKNKTRNIFASSAIHVRRWQIAEPSQISQHSCFPSENQISVASCGFGSGFGSCRFRPRHLSVPDSALVCSGLGSCRLWPRLWSGPALPHSGPGVLLVVVVSGSKTLPFIRCFPSMNGILLIIGDRSFCSPPPVRLPSVDSGDGSRVSSHAPVTLNPPPLVHHVRVLTLFPCLPSARRGSRGRSRRQRRRPVPTQQGGS